MLESSAKYKKDMWIWAEHSEDVWKPARIIEVLDKTLKVSLMNEKTISLPKKNAWTVLSIGSFNEDMQNPDICMDFSKMRSLSTESVLHFLRQAYHLNKFYSHLGAGTILAVNPFHDVKGLFSDEKMRAYHSASLAKLSVLPPHVFSVAERALRDMLSGISVTNQSIIISGESGAGKTWTVRCLMRYFATVGMNSAQNSDTQLSDSFVTVRMNSAHSLGPGDPPESSDVPLSDSFVTIGINSAFDPEEPSENSDVPASDSFVTVGINSAHSFDPDNPPRSSDVRLSDSFVGDQIEHRILCSNPILEAFGNAATPRNHNSSRFGKFIQLQYDWCGNIVGARLQVYLLEKSRVASIAKSDKPYHIFAQMLRGSTEAEKTEWLLTDIVKCQENKSFPTNTNNNNRILNLNDSIDSMTEDDGFKANLDFECMDGEMAFKKTRKAMLGVGIAKSVQCQIFKLLSAILHLEKMSFEGNDDLSTPCTLISNSQLNGKHAASLLSVPINSLLQAVTVREIQAGGSKSRDRRRSVFFRSCTKLECAARRDALMKFLYEQIFLWLVRHIGDDLSPQSSEACSFIGLLDVYGFESFHQNGLEQLCINYANEKLQQYYVSNFLKLQQEELSAEGITWQCMGVNYKDGCLMALEGTHNSLFALLNEECRLNRPRDAMQLKDRIGDYFGANSFVTIPRISSTIPRFAVAHYAGMVEYETESLIAKNKDELPVEIAHLLKNSDSDFIQRSISENLNSSLSKQNGSRGKHHETLLTDFKKSLDDLLKTVSSTNCHYIRCIKPNKHSVPSHFDSFYVADQLRSSGVVETIRICGKMHPHRVTYRDFVAHYRFLTKHQHVNSLCSLTDDYDQTQRACCKILSVVFQQTPHLDRSESLWKFGKTCVFLSSSLFETLQLERSKEMSRNAVKIQRFWVYSRSRRRCRKLRKQLIEERRTAAAVIQKAWRAKLHRRKCAQLRKIEEWRRMRAARLLQFHWNLYLEQKTEKERAANEETETTVEMVTFPILTVPEDTFLHATIQSTKLEVAESKSSDSSNVNTFNWVCRPKHNLIERYFPSMAQMNFCRITSSFSRPLDIVALGFEKLNFDSLFLNQAATNLDLSDDESCCLSSNVSASFHDSPILPLCSFDLYNQSFSLPTPTDHSILPFSNVKPREAS